MELIDRLALDSGTRRPLVVLPREVGAIARFQAELGARWPIAPEAFALMAQNWRYSSRKAKRELGYTTRPLDATLRRTADWYAELIGRGAIGGGTSAMSVASRAMRFADRLGVVAAMRVAERYAGRRLVTGP